MFAIAFDLVVAETEQRHPKGAPQADADLALHFGVSDSAALQGSVYVTDGDNMATLFEAIMALKALPWFPASARVIRAFRIEQWSEFTPVIKKPQAPTCRNRREAGRGS